MKKFISGVILALVMAGSVALAKTVPVVALTPFASNSPTETMVVKVKSNIQVTDDVVLFENFTVKGKVVPTNNGAFAFVPFSYINVHNEELPVKAQTYGVFAGFVVNGQTTPVASPFNINAGQMFILNFKDVQEEVDNSVNKNLSGSPTDATIDLFVPATEESQRPFSTYLPGLPRYDVPTMDSTNLYNPAMPLGSILKQREFLR